MSKRFTGKKLTGSHGTHIDAAASLLSFVHRLESVDKISLGIIRKCGRSGGPQSIKLAEIPAGLEITVRGNIFAQTLYVYIKDPAHNTSIERKKIELFAKSDNKNVIGGQEHDEKK